jgi:hypothetical protein
MSATDAGLPAAPQDPHDSLRAAGVNFLAITLGWLPAIFFGSAVGDATNAGVAASFFVAMLAYLTLVAGALMLSRSLP